MLPRCLDNRKNAYQAEIDSACELIDFLRFNVHFMGEIYRDQPESGPGVWNRIEYRPLEGFTFALTPFNFTAIGGNLPSSMALMGQYGCMETCQHSDLFRECVYTDLKRSGLTGWCD